MTMRYKVTFVIGFAAGYTLGSKAGRERYEQISQAARTFAENPAVQSVAGMLQAQVARVAGTAKSAVVEKVTGTADPYGPGPVPAAYGGGNGVRPTP
jgi:hypothetical protein